MADLSAVAEQLDPLYTSADRERFVADAPKRVEAPERTPFERDRARVVHAASMRRLAAKTQVVGPQSDDFVRNRLTHSLEVAQIARDLSRALNGPQSSQPDIAETAALAHDLGHPPFGHNGEVVLAEVAREIGGFEGNAQTFRILTRLEAKSFASDGRSAGLNLTRATLDACSKYPWRARETESAKFGVYDDDSTVFDWMRTSPGTCIEAQIMDLADDIAYSVHDVEDGIVAGKIDPREVRVSPHTFHELSAPVYDGSRRSLAALKNFTSDLIGRFCHEVRTATMANGDGPYVRYLHGLVVPGEVREAIEHLKGIARHFIMDDPEHLATLEEQRTLLAELVHEVARRGAEALTRQYADDWHAAADDAGRLRVVVDQIASLTDVTAVEWHARLTV